MQVGAGASPARDREAGNVTTVEDKPFAQLVRDVVSDNVRKGMAGRDRANQFLAEFGQPSIPEEVYLQYGDSSLVINLDGVTREEAIANRQQYAEQIVAALNVVGQSRLTVDEVAKRLYVRSR